MLKRILTILSLVLFAMLTLHSASAASIQNVGILGDSRYKLIDGASNYTPSLDSYPFNSKKVIEAPFQTLYGENKGFIVYKGEIPRENAEEYKSYRVFNGEKIKDNIRTWNPKKADISGESEDLHIKAATYTGEWDWLTYSMYFIFHIFEGLTNWLLKMVTYIKTIDMQSIFDIFDKSGEFKKAISKLFLFDPDTGNMSPILMIAIIGFGISGLIGLSKVIKGTSPMQVFKEELLFLILAFIFAGTAINFKAQDNVSSTGLSILTKMSNDLITSNDTSYELYKANTGDTKKDNDATQVALIEKKNIDGWIKTVTGSTVEQLDLNEKNFGKDWEKAMQNVLKSDEESYISNFTVSNGKSTYSNLGYFLYAADSGVNPLNPIKGTDGFNKGDNYYPLLVVDFLEQARQLAITNKETDALNNIENIAKNLSITNYTEAMTSALLNAISNFFLALCLATVTGFLIIGEFIVIIGPFFLPIIPILLLIRSTRKTAKDLSKIYVSGYVRYVIGLIIFNMFITLSVLLSQSVTGVLIGVILFYLLFKYTPKMLKVVNANLQRSEPYYMRNLTSNSVWDYKKSLKQGKDKVSDIISSRFSKPSEVSKINVDSAEKISDETEEPERIENRDIEQKQLDVTKSHDDDGPDGPPDGPTPPPALKNRTQNDESQTEPINTNTGGGKGPDPETPNIGRTSRDEAPKTTAQNRNKGSNINGNSPKEDFDPRNNQIMIEEEPESIKEGRRKIDLNIEKPKEPVKIEIPVKEIERTSDTNLEAKPKEKITIMIDKSPKE